MSRPSAPRARTVAAAVCALTATAVLVAACGGGSSAKTTSTTSTTVAGRGGFGGAALQAFRTCLRQHGVALPTPTTTPGETFVTRPPDALGRRGGSGLGAGSGGLGAVLSDPADRAAVQACQGDLPAGFLQQQQQRRQQLNAFLSCMKDNGVTIPTVAGGNPPRGLGSGLGSVDRTSPAYQKCSVLLPNGGNFGPRAPTSSTTTPS